MIKNRSRKYKKIDFHLLKETIWFLKPPRKMLRNSDHKVATVKEAINLGLSEDYRVIPRDIELQFLYKASYLQIKICRKLKECQVRSQSQNHLSNSLFLKKDHQAKTIFDKFKNSIIIKQLKISFLNFSLQIKSNKLILLVASSSELTSLSSRRMIFSQLKNKSKKAQNSLIKIQDVI